MHRAAFAEEPSAENLEDAIGLLEHLPKTRYVLRIVRPRLIILIEWDRFRKFIRSSMDAHIELELVHFLHDPLIEGGDRLRLEP
jgi:hypothetical protein